jgi:hypothetical protein
MCDRDKGLALTGVEVNPEHRSWETFGIHDVPPGDLSVDRLFPETGWGALLCWIVGPGHVARVPAAAVPVEPVSVQRVHAGASTVTEVARTPADQELIDDAVDEYLCDAGVPPRPRTYAWVLLGDTRWGGVGELSRALQRAVEDAGWPAEPAAVLNAGLRSLRP